MNGLTFNCNVDIESTHALTDDQEYEIHRLVEGALGVMVDGLENFSAEYNLKDVSTGIEEVSRIEEHQPKELTS